MILFGLLYCKISLFIESAKQSVLILLCFFVVSKQALYCYLRFASSLFIKLLGREEIIISHSNL